MVNYALSTEKGIRLMESENKLVFNVPLKANKKEIKEDIEKTFNVKILSVKTVIEPTGKKKAYVKFSNETPALDIATKLGMM